MSFAKLAAASLVDEEHIDKERADAKRKKLLLGLAGLAGVAGLGGLAWANRDKLKALGGPPKDERGIIAKAVDKGKAFIDDPWGSTVSTSADPRAMAAGGVMAAVGPGAWKGYKELKAGPLSAEQLLANTKDRNRFPDKQIGGKLHETWFGPVDPNAAQAVGRITKSTGGSTSMQQLLEDFHRNNLSATAADFKAWVGNNHDSTIAGPTGKGGRATNLLVDKHSVLPDIKHFERRNSFMKWTPGHMAGRGLGGMALTAAPAVLNWLGNQISGSGK